MLRFLTAGESHGKSLSAIIEGFPAGVPLSAQDINYDLERRQKGHGRGKRQEIESDKAEILSGVRGGETIGSPITLKIDNLDWENWRHVMAPDAELSSAETISRPRPGHADFTGALKYNRYDMRDILERASARETAVRTAVGAVCKKMLSMLDIDIISHVVEIGGVGWSGFSLDKQQELDFSAVNKKIDDSPVRCFDDKTQERMISKIDEVSEAGDTLGGIFEIIVIGTPPGLGSHVHWDRRLEGKLAAVLMSLNGVKGVEIGLGKDCARKLGSEVHDEIKLKDGRIWRSTNRAGGIEGGITNGENLVIKVSQKPISTLGKSLTSVDLKEMVEKKAHHERSDVCAVPAASIIGEALTAVVLAEAVIDKFGGDTIGEIKDSFTRYLFQISARGWSRN